MASAQFIKPLLVGMFVSGGFAPAVLAADEDRSPLTLDLGNGATATFYGYVKADFIWDDGFDLGRNTGGLKSIGLPTGPAAGQFDRQQLSESRIGVDVQRPDGFFARLEGDFYGADDSLRLRHAYVSWYGVMIGQNWTNFMSVENLADTVDFATAGAYPFARLPQVRYTYEGWKNWKVSASVEEDVGNSDDYAYTLAARYGFSKGMARASGMWRDTALNGTAVKGWGLNISTVLGLWSGGKIKANVTTGEGIADILNSGLSGTAVSLNGNPVGVNSAALTVSHQVTDKLKIAATGSWLNLEQSVGTDTDSLQTLHLSAFYEVFRNTTVMAEFYTGTRKQADGARFDSDRIQLAIKYVF